MIIIGSTGIISVSGGFVIFYEYPKDWFQLAFSVLDSVIVTYHGILNIFATDSGDSVPRIINLHSLV